MKQNAYRIWEPLKFFDIFFRNVFPEKRHEVLKDNELIRERILMYFCETILTARDKFKAFSLSNILDKCASFIKKSSSAKSLHYFHIAAKCEFIDDKKRKLEYFGHEMKGSKY